MTTDSIANVSQVVTLDKDDLEDRMGSVNRPALRAIEAGLRRVLGL